MSLPLKHIYRFDSFVLDVDEQVLLRDGKMVPLTPKVFETLLLLVQHQGSIVTKQTILTTLWPDVFVEESNITFNITKLRKALGDTKKSSLYIETIPRRGYRFKSEVREVVGADKSADSRISEVAASLNGNPNGDWSSEVLSRPNQTSSDFKVEQFQATPDTSIPFSKRFSLRAGRRSFLTLSIFAALGLLLIAAAVSWRLNLFRLRKQDEGKPVLTAPSNAKQDLRFEQISAYGSVVAAAISPDAKQVAYVQENAGHQSVWIMQLGSFANIQLIPPSDAVYNKVCFSHDGNYVYFAKHSENQTSDLYRIPTLHGPATKIHENVQGNYSLSSDDRKVVFRRRNLITREDELLIADLNNDQERTLTTHKEPDWIKAFALSPDGNSVVYATGETDSARATMGIREVKVQTSEDKLLLTPNWYYVRQFEWLPKGDGLLLLARETSTVDPQIWRLSYPDCALQKLTNDLNDYLSFTLNGDGTKLVAIQSVLDSHIWVSDIKGNNAKDVADGRGRIAWSTDGRLIYNSASVWGSDLWIAKADGTDPKQLSFNAGFNDWPSISPDGRTIVFQSNRTGSQHLWKMDLDGNDQVQLTNGYAERNAAFSPDGGWVYYNSSQNSFLWKVAAQGGPPIQLTTEYAAYPSISPDGELIATFHFPTKDNEARITVRRTRDMTTIAELALAPGFWISRSIQWDADSNALIYAIQDNGKVKLFRKRLGASAPHEVTTFNAEDEFEFALSPDRKQLAFISTKWNHYAVLIDGFR